MSYETYEVEVRSDGAQFWRQNDKLHRLDGPAVIYSVHNQHHYIHGEYLTKEEFEAHPETPFEVKTVTIDGVEYELKRKGA